ncbi:hypothetical protein U9M48_041371 [Paspalum notatum var. saurae]|uniref:Uncharacterized protein n=1 Tax=Paspalum notatum var. saurae TaxID=547442 RepID=A0AAQ3XGG6_PASNO
MPGDEDGEQPSYVTQEQLQKLMKDFNKQLNENMSTIQANMIAEVVKNMKASGATSLHLEELDETDEEIAAHLQREEQDQAHAHEQGHGRGGGGAAFGQGRGRGRGNGAAHDTEPQDTFRLHRNDNFRRRFPNFNDQPNEEKFGKLKFSMPKFEGTSDPDACLTWELKVEKIFRMHNVMTQVKLT